MKAIALVGRSEFVLGEGYLEELARMGFTDLILLYRGSPPACPISEILSVSAQEVGAWDCADFTADEPFLLMWGRFREKELAAAARLHRTYRGAITLLLRSGGVDGLWTVACDRRGRVNYLEEQAPVLRCEGTMVCAGAALFEPMPGLPLPTEMGDLLSCLRFWMDRGELWGAAGEKEIRVESRAAMGDDVTENPLYFL